MKNTFVKIMLLLVVLAVALTGCNLIGIDPVKQAAEDIAKVQKNLNVPVAAYGDQQLMAGDVIGPFNTNYNQLYYMYYYYGMQLTDEDINQIMESVIRDEVRSRVIAGHFDELGLALTDEENAACEEEAKSVSDEAYNAYLEESTAKTDAEKDAEARVTLEKMGYTYEKQLADAIRAKQVEKVEQAIRDQITEVTDEQLTAAYEAAVAADTEKYTADPGAFGSAMTGETPVYYAPEGYRTVKHILLQPSEDVMTAYTDAVAAVDAKEAEIAEREAELVALNDDDETTTAEHTELQINADIAAAEAEIPALAETAGNAALDCIADVQDKVTEIYARLTAGEDFEALIEAYGEDPGMQNEPTKSRGYYVSADSTNWEENFTTASMLLENVGDYTLVPAVSGSGVHIIKYMSDVPAGAVPFDDVRDALYETTLETMKTDHFNETVDQWLAENPTTSDVPAFRNAIATISE